MSQPAPNPPREKWSSALLNAFDHYALQARPYVLIGIVAFLMTLFLIAFCYPSSLPLVQTAQIALAVGTLALAYAAVLQVASSVESRREEERWRAQQKLDRAKDRTPNVDIKMRGIRVVRKVGTGLSTTGSEATALQPFEQEELYLENVGPGIAANVRATLTRLYLDLALESPTLPEEDVTPVECLSVERILRPETDRHYEIGELGLPSSYLAIGPENRMGILNTDEQTAYSKSENMESDRVYVVGITYTDIEGNGPKSVTGGAFWYPMEKGPGGKPIDLDDTFETRSRWYPASSDLVQRVLADAERWKRSSEEGQLKEHLAALRSQKPG